MIDPNQMELLREFVDYLEKDYVIMKQKMFKDNSIWYNETPKKGDTTILKVIYKSERPKDEEIDDRIELFLKKRTR